MLVGPGVGSLIMLTLGPIRGIFVNALFYLPLFLWLVAAPFGRTFRASRPVRSAPCAAGGHRANDPRDRAAPGAGAMVLLAGAASFFVGNSYQAQMPGFAQDLGHGNPGATSAPSR